MHTSQENAEIAANTIKLGAVDYIVKGNNAFSRLDIVMNNIFKTTELQKSLGSQKTMSWILMILLALLIVGYITTK